jgi:hypothetical protein
MLVSGLARGWTMELDLGIGGAALLVLMALAFGVVAQIVAGPGTTRWMWSIGAGTFFVVGLLISEARFGWATEEDLQPNYDGLSFDETLLAIIPSAVVVYAVRRVIRRRRAAQEGTAGTVAGPPRSGPRR